MISGASSQANISSPVNCQLRYGAICHLLVTCNIEPHALSLRPAVVNRYKQLAMASSSKPRTSGVDPLCGISYGISSAVNRSTHFQTCVFAPPTPSRLTVLVKGRPVFCTTHQKKSNAYVTKAMAWLYLARKSRATTAHLHPSVLLQFGLWVKPLRTFGGGESDQEVEEVWAVVEQAAFPHVRQYVTYRQSRDLRYKLQWNASELGHTRKIRGLPDSAKRSTQSLS